ncbi:MAG: class I SAM-dependent methyltransferase [Gaiellaceae bacterium]
MARNAIHQAAQAFDHAAEAYDRGRPGFPPEAIATLVEALGIAAGVRVLDLAAGTGKLTRMLTPTGAELVAVEPLGGMRVRLEESLPGIRALEGTAEAIPLPDASVAAVTVAQAFHWFDGHAALGEIHRVLARGGRLGLLWNVKDEDEDWIAQLGEIVEPHRGTAPRYLSGRWRRAFEETALFTPLIAERCSHVHEVEVEGVVDRILSISFIAALTEGEREQVAELVRRLLAEHPETRGRETIRLPYRTDVYWCGRVERG